MILRNYKNYYVLGLVVLLVMGMVASTWAYATQTQQAVNEFQTGKYSTFLVEEFEPPNDWKPGQEVNKDVKVTNEGTVPVFASITINQEWLRRENVYDADGNVILPAAGDPFPNTFAGVNGEEYAALIKWGEDVVVLASGKAGNPTLGLPTVNSPEEAKGKWLLASETPDKDGNFTFYYMGVVEEGGETPKLLDGVELNPSIQGSIISEDTVWDEENQKWVTTKVENPTHDYQNAHYNLGVTMNTVQATEEAMKEMFGSDLGSSQEVITYLESISVLGKDVDYSRDDSVTEKKLYLAESNGKLTYTPSSPDENWFMSHLNMMPGEEYEDTLLIENETKKDYALFMQVVPRNGYTEGLPQELLELIHMKVYYNDELIYDGTAWGKDYEGSIKNLQNVISLGKYGSGAEGKIRVALELDKDTPLEYADLLTQIDWKWVVAEDVTEDPPKPTDPPSPQGTPDTPTPTYPPESPSTGDNTTLIQYIGFMSVSGIAVILLLIYDHRRKKKHEI